MASVANCVVYFSNNTNCLTIFKLKNHSLHVATFLSRPFNTLGKRSVRLTSSTTGINSWAAGPSATAVESDGNFNDSIPTPNIIIDQDSDLDATIVEITFGNRLGAFLDTMNALKSIGLNVTKEIQRVQIIGQPLIMELHILSECGFCANKADEVSSPGACLAKATELKDACHGQNRIWFNDGCPSKIGFLAIILLGFYIISFFPRMGTAPWIVNSEIYPLKYRGLGGGLATMCNWIANLNVSGTFLTLTKALGSAGTFLLFAGFCVNGTICICWFVPETKGLPFEEVEKMLKTGFKPIAFRRKSKGK